MKFKVTGQCNSLLPKSNPKFCNGKCCHYLGERGYGKDIQLACRLIKEYTGASSYTIKDFARDFAYNAVYRTEERFWDDNLANPSGQLGGCRFQNPDGSCKLRLMDEQEGNTKNEDYYTTDEPKYHLPSACRKFPFDIVSDNALLAKLREQLKVGDKYALSRIWPKCGFTIKVVE
jgi:hypothetical protein